MKKVKLAIDFGSANMKMVGLINDVFQKRIIKSLADTSNVCEQNVVEYNSEKVYFGIGDPLVKQNKTKRDYIIESILFATNAIYGELDNNFEIQLAIGLPLSEYMSPDKNDYKAELEHDYLNKKITGKVNGNDITIKITYINIYAEGYSGFVALMDNIDTKIPVLIIDIGYKTTDLIGIKQDSFTGDLVVDNYGNIHKGMLEILQDITKQFNYDNKSICSIDSIEEALVNNTELKIYTNKGKESKNIYQWLKCGKKELSTIFNEIEVKYFPDMKMRNVYLIGGGVEIINHILSEIDNKSEAIETERFKNNKENDTLMFANVKGYLLQLMKDTFEIVESENVFVSDKKLSKTVALAED
jgi:hypothetical protein